jgi:hypothetical protein
VWTEISKHVGDDDYVIPAERFRDSGLNRTRRDNSLSPASDQAIWRLVKAVADRAGLPVDEIGPTRSATPTATTWPDMRGCR